MRRLLPALALLVSGTAAAGCPSLSHYQVAGLTLRGGALDAAVNQVLEGSAWKAEFSGPVERVRLRMSGVSGDMDAVLKMIVETAARDASVAGVSSTIDASSCVVRVVAAPLPPPPPAPAPVAASTSAEVAAAPAASTGPSVAARPAVTPAVAPSVRAAPSDPVWAARRGSTLRQSLESWASKANCTAPDALIAGQSTWSLAWAPADVDYRIAAPLTFDGSISEAAQALIRLYANADVRLGLRVHPNQCVLHVFAAGRN